MEQDSNAITKFAEVEKIAMEFIEEMMRENDGKENVIFSQKAKDMVKRIAEFSRKTKIYSEMEVQREEFWNETKDITPALVYGYILDRIADAPTLFHARFSVILLIPKLDELLNGTVEGAKVMNEELKKLAEKYGWDLEVWHGEYKGVLCGVQETNPGDDPLPLYRFPGGISLA